MQNTLNNKKVLLTGATGFVGRQVLRQLLARGAQVTVVTRKAIEADQGFEQVITPDLFAESTSWWLDNLAGVDTVIHCAWYAEPGKYLTSELNFACLDGSVVLARAAQAAGVQRFVGVGTCFEYDFAAAGELDDLATDTPLRPTTLYAAAKASLWLTLSNWLAQVEGNAMTFAWARLFYLYGEGEDPRRLVALLHGKLSKGEEVPLSTGEQVRDFMDIEQAGAKLVDIAERELTGALNVCTGEGITIRALAERIADQYGRRDLLQFGKYPGNLTDPPRVVGIPSL